MIGIRLSLSWIIVTGDFNMIITRNQTIQTLTEETKTKLHHRHTFLIGVPFVNHSSSPANIDVKCLSELQVFLIKITKALDTFL